MLLPPTKKLYKLEKLKLFYVRLELCLSLPILLPRLREIVLQLGYLNTRSIRKAIDAFKGENKKLVLIWSESDDGLLNQQPLIDYLCTKSHAFKIEILKKDNIWIHLERGACFLKLSNLDLLDDPSIQLFLNQNISPLQLELLNINENSNLQNIISKCPHVNRLTLQIQKDEEESWLSIENSPFFSPLQYLTNLQQVTLVSHLGNDFDHWTEVLKANQNCLQAITAGLNIQLANDPPLNLEDFMERAKVYMKLLYPNYNPFLSLPNSHRN